MRMHTEGTPSWLWSPLNQVRWSTVLTAGILFAVITWQTRRPVLAVAATMAWLWGYEIIYQATGTVVHRWSLMSLGYTVAGTTGWLIATYMFGVRLDWRIVAAFAGLWVVWILLGFNSNMSDRIIPGADRTFSWSDEALNVATKAVAAAAVLAGALVPNLKGGASRG